MSTQASSLHVAEVLGQNYIFTIVKNVVVLARYTIILFGLSLQRNRDTLVQTKQKVTKAFSRHHSAHFDNMKERQENLARPMVSHICCLVELETMHLYCGYCMPHVGHRGKIHHRNVALAVCVC